MPISLSIFEVKRLAQYIKERIVGGIIEKIYQSNSILYFSIRKEGTKIFLKYVPKQILCTTFKREQSLSLGQAAQFLRKRFCGAKVLDVYQYDNERIIIVRTSKGDLIFELFPPGRIILDGYYIRDGKVFKESVQLPKERVIDINGIRSATKDIVRYLAVDLGLGGKVAEEVCRRAGVDKNKKCSSLTDDEIKRIKDALSNIAKEIESSECFYVLNGNVYFFKPSNSAQEFSSLEDAVDSILLETHTEPKNKDIERKIEALRKSLEAAQRTLEEYKRKYEEIRRAADSLFLQYGRVPRKITVAGETIEIPGGYSTEKAAALLYEIAKKYKEKMRKAQKAIEDMKKRLEELEKSKEEEKKVVIVDVESRLFRTFVSSEGFKIILGKNAISNEILLRKYMESNDIVLHAEIRGSPFALIKGARKALPERTIKEAANLTLCYSRAWKEGSAVPVYWVYPEQVSKKAPAGEYLPLGSFMIYGKKNYVKDLELRLAVGLKGDRIMVGVPSMFSNEEIICIVEPGDTDKNDAVKEIIRRIKKVASIKGDIRSYLLSMLPQGVCLKFNPHLEEL